MVDKVQMMLRTRKFAVSIIVFVSKLPKTTAGQIIGRQLIRSGTSVGANYRSALRGKSRADFTAKLGIVEEELDEVQYWLEVLVESQILEQERIQTLHDEADQLLRIIVTTIKSTKLASKSNPKS